MRDHGITSEASARRVLDEAGIRTRDDVKRVIENRSKAERDELRTRLQNGNVDITKIDRSTINNSARNRMDIRDRNVSQKIVNNVNVNIQNNYFSTPRYTNMFDDRWYRRYPSYWYPVHPIHPRAWWRPAPAWEYACGWFAAGFFTHYVLDRALTPIPYYYGTNIYYVDDMVYINGVPYVSASVYYAQAAEIAARGVQQAPVTVQVPVEVVVNVEAPSATVETAPLATDPPVADAPQDDWMPMGTFAILEDPKSTDASLVIQLATNKSGLIAGNVIDMKSDEVSPVYGAVDSETQRVAMRIEGREEIVECGLWNLTQDTLPVLLHVDEGKTEERTFVRLTDPEEEELAP